MSNVVTNLKSEMSKKCTGYYLKGVPIHYSFDAIEQVAIGMGADMDKGDIMIIDNVNGDKRKWMKKTANGFLIMYAKLNKDVWTELPKMIKALDNVMEVLDYTK